MVAKASFAELSNTPIEMVLGGKTLKVRRVGLDTIFGKAEMAVRSKAIANIRAMADGIDDPKERTVYLSAATRDAIPSGQELNQMTAEYLRSLDGVKMVTFDALRRDQPMIEQELDISKVIREEPDTVRMVVEFAIGGPKKEEGADEQSPHPLGVPPAAA